MRFTMLLTLAALAVGLSACQSTHEEGVKSNYMTQWTTVNADTNKTTDASKAVLEEEGLKEIKASSTNLDGTATAKKADGSKVQVKVQKKGDTGSEVSVNVGTMGDPAVGAEIARKIKERAEKK